MSTSAEKLKARDRILEAAVKVFAEQGIKGATTREIARVAEVNETTLFRNFQNKDALLKAVVDQSVQRISEALEGPGMSHHDLYQDLMTYARAHMALLEKNEALVRMFVGEARRQMEESRCIVHNAWQPVREQLTGYIRAAQAEGRVKAELDPDMIVDLLKGTIFAHVMGRGLHQPKYTPDDYLETALSILVQGISTNPQ